MDVEWDPAKHSVNLAKHGISFSDTEPAFYDDNALSMADSFATTEERFMLVGCDAFGRILTIAYTYRNDRIRIISARMATKSEHREYERGIRL